ncbi:rhodanese-like domain-containing protein [Tenacibaculum ovolyticum]|uniref:rhodanese-like domain-containing protein n=1 Tax=Tenacibaculum ovolyticum TaxID=104270 RepID=UPI001F2CE4C8|nr:rhodanese-like domain-containing protein [Tenacibaculum ovolyticum]
MKNNLFFIGLVFTIIMSCTSKENVVKDITIDDLQLILKANKNIQLLDVRTPEECAKGTIENAIEINVTDDTFKSIILEKLDKTKTVYVYCRSGGRSKIASDMLLKEGFNPYNVLGGYLEWKEKNK